MADLRFVTLINPADAFSLDGIRDFDPRKIINRTRRALERIGVQKDTAFALGCVDVEWDRGWEVFQPHLHLIAYGITKQNLAKLITRWPKEPERVRVRRRHEPIDDLPRVVAYLEKGFWPAVCRKVNPKGLHPHGKRRPCSRIEIKILRWLGKHQASDLRMLFGVKQYNTQPVRIIHTKPR